MLPEYDDRARPVTTPDGLTMSTITDDALSLPRSTDTPLVARCGACGHAIWAPESVGVGLGRRCRRGRSRAVRETRVAA
jgi:hypothetical protein